MEFLAQTPDGTEIRFVDRKRWLWLAPLIVPTLTVLTYGIYFWSGKNLLTLTIPFIYFYVLIPAADAVFGGDTENPPEEVVGDLSQDSFYEIVAYALIPFHYVSFIATAWFVASEPLPLWAILLLGVSVGLMHGNMINIGHELGHKLDKRNRVFAKLALGLSGYGHFTIEHNRGHHVMVSTPEDCASARFGESVYAFMFRELPGALKGGWAHEARRLEKKGLPLFHWQNEILQVYAITLVVTLALVSWLGVAVLPFIILHHFFSFFGLTIVNYIEHYGLLRGKKPNGKYEPCEPRHSWNSNHVVSNLLSLHLQRHSDHHANPMRPYQALRDFDDVPVLPSGYPGSIFLAAIPPLWFRVMNPRVLEWAGGDMDKVNVCPRWKVTAPSAIAKV
ncbi:MAG: alkane 1-monooxygenase [Pseudomonadota bacterium]